MADNAKVITLAEVDDDDDDEMSILMKSDMSEICNVSKGPNNVRLSDIILNKHSL